MDKYDAKLPSSAYNRFKSGIISLLLFFNTVNMKKGFTLVELLIVIAVIAILAAVVFVALDPLTRFRDARDSRRAADIAAIASAIRVDQVDNGGAYIWAVDHVASAATGTAFMITSATTTSGCNVTCDASVSATDKCVNLQGLANEGYLGSVPVSPNGTGNWTSGANHGYYLQYNANNSITVGSCESENQTSISVTR